MSALAREYKSRIAGKPVTIPAGVNVNVSGARLTVKGPKGTSVVDVHEFVTVAVDGAELSIALSKQPKKNITGPRGKLYRSIAGTVRANIHNVIHGVAHGFEKKLSLVGVGYKAQAKGKVLSLNLGFSHPTDFPVPEGVTIETPTPTEILVKGFDKALVGLVAAKIRKVRGPEPYKGKGVRYATEVIELKETKKK